MPWAASLGVNVVSLGPAARAQAIAARYREEWEKLGKPPQDLPKIGITRHIVVAPSDAQAKRIARAAYPRWANAIAFLWERSGIDFLLKGIYPKEWDALESLGHGVAGSPDTVRAYLENLQRETGVNYVLCQMIFGDLTFADAEASLTLFGGEVMPALR